MNINAKNPRRKFAPLLGSVVALVMLGLIVWMLIFAWRTMSGPDKVTHDYAREPNSPPSADIEMAHVPESFNRDRPNRYEGLQLALAKLPDWRMTDITTSAPVDESKSAKIAAAEMPRAISKEGSPGIDTIPLASVPFDVQVQPEQSSNPALSGIHLEIASTPWQSVNPDSAPPTVTVPLANVDSQASDEGHENYQGLNLSVAELMKLDAPLHAYVPPQEAEPFQFPPAIPGGDTIPLNPRVIALERQAEPEIIAGLRQWEIDVAEGRRPSDKQREELRELLAATQISAVDCYRIGRAMWYVEGPSVGADWYRAAARRAEAELSVLKNPGDEKNAAAPTATLRWISRPLYGAGDFTTCEHVCALLCKWEPPGSKAAARAVYSEADAAFLQGPHDSAANDRAIVLALELLGDKRLTPVEQAEVHYLAARALAQGGRNGEAIPHFEIAAKEPSHAAQVLPELIEARARANKNSQ